jgi:hypothetical protein
MEKENLFLELGAGGFNLQITHGLASDFTVTSSVFPNKLFLYPQNTDYTLPVPHKTSGLPSRSLKGFATPFPLWEKQKTTVFLKNN